MTFISTHFQSPICISICLLRVHLQDSVHVVKIHEPEVASHNPLFLRFHADLSILKVAIFMQQNVMEYLHSDVTAQYI